MDLINKSSNHTKILKIIARISIIFQVFTVAAVGGVAVVLVVMLLPVGFREMMWTVPLFLSVVPLLAVTGILLNLSVLLNLSQEQRSATNVLLWVGAIFSAVGTLSAFTWNMEKITQRSIPFTVVLTPLEIIVNIVPLACLILLYRSSGSQPSIDSDLPYKPRRGNKTLSTIFVITLIVLVVVNVWALFQTRITNPGIERIARQAPFTVYGLREKSSYRWVADSLRLKVQPEPVVGGLIHEKRVGISPILISVAQGKRGMFNAQLQEVLQGKHVTVKTIMINGESVPLYSSTVQTPSVTFVLWRLLWASPTGTDIYLQGTVDAFINPEATFAEVIHDLTPFTAT